MDIIAENPETASGPLPKTCETSSLVRVSCSNKAAILFSSKSSVGSSPFPVHLEPHDVLSLISGVSATFTAGDVPPAEMSLALVEPSAMARISSSPRFPPKDTDGLVVQPSTSVLHSSVTSGSAFAATSMSCSHLGTPMYSPSLPFETLMPSSSPGSIQDFFGAKSSDAGFNFLGSLSLGDGPRPDVSSGSVALNYSGLLPTGPAPVGSVERSHVPLLQMSSSQMAARANETLSFSSMDASKHKHSALLPSAPDKTCSLQTSNLSRSELQPAVPLASVEKLSSLPAPSESNLELPPSSVASSLLGVRERDPAALSMLLLGTSTGLLTEHERSSLETSTSFPSAPKANTLKRQRPAELAINAPGPCKRSKMECKAGNSKCGLETGRSILLGDRLCLDCDVCCTEAGFCQECKCILCCKTIIPEVGESNVVRCLQRPSGNGMCGHAAHLECALHSNMAGVVKERGLDMEYLCRRCDNKTDLRELVTLLLEAVGNAEGSAQAEKSLQLALEIMKGTQRGGSGGKVLESLVRTALRKVQSGFEIKEVFRELKDQGAAAEAARQQHFGRGSSLMEDLSQHLEASLDQWLPSSGSPSAHPSPGTPSSFTSPRLRSNRSVTSGEVNGNRPVDGSLRKYRGAEGHVDHSVQPKTSHGGFASSKYKNSNFGNKTRVRNVGQPRGSDRFHAFSSSIMNNGIEAICDSFTTRMTRNHVAELGLWDGNSPICAKSTLGTISLKDQQDLSTGAGKLSRDMVFTDTCKSCAAVRRHTLNCVDTSSLKFLKIEDGGKKFPLRPSTPREEEPGESDACKQVTKSDIGFERSAHVHSTISATGNKALASALQLLDLQCERDMHIALQKLRLAQESEFECATAFLTARRESIIKKYKLLETTRREFYELPVQSSLQAFDELLVRTGTQFAGVLEERANFKSMLKIGDGFGSFSKDDLKLFFCWPLEK